MSEHEAAGYGRCDECGDCIADWYGGDPSGGGGGPRMREEPVPRLRPMVGHGRRPRGGQPDVLPMLRGTDATKTAAVALDNGGLEYKEQQKQEG